MVSSNLKLSSELDAATAQKFLSPVPYERGFHFFSPDGHYSGESALSLLAFLKDLDRMEIETIRYHFDRGDFQKWIRTTIGDEELANRLSSLEKNCSDEVMMRELNEVVKTRLAELLGLIKSP